MKKLIIGLIIIFFILIVIIIGKVNTNNILTDPYVLNDFTIIQKDIKKGFTIKDKYDNEWVWIVVPKNIFKNAKNNKDYENIYNDLKKYVNEYHDDKFNDSSFLETRNKVLSSIFTYGGFYVSRYEIGTDDIRNRNSTLSLKAYSQKNKYVYNYVTRDDAVNIAKEISNYETNLLFGFQWDLICKFIEEYGYHNDEKITKDMILVNSTSWGNYYSSSFDINEGKYSKDYGNTYEEIKDNFKKSAYQNYLLTTGCAENNKVLNIYDFAGNVSEWTLEESINNMYVIRDGSFSFNYGGSDPVAGRYELSIDSKDKNYGFRISLIK